MNKIRPIIYFLSITALILIISQVEIKADASQQQIDLSLWHLSTDEDGRNARLVQTELSTHHVAQEVILPPDLIISSVQWSPDMRYIAATIVEEETVYLPLTWEPKLCIFSSDGGMLGCKPFSILVMQRQRGDSFAPIAWSRDSRSIFVVTDSTSDDSQGLQIATFDVEQMSVTSSTAVKTEFSSIQAWEWALDVKRAAVYASADQLYIIKFDTQVEVHLLEPQNVLYPVWSQNQRMLVYPYHEPPELGASDSGYYDLRIARWNDGDSISTEHLGVPTFNGGEVIPDSLDGLSIAAETNQLAFVVNELVDGQPYGRRATIYIMSIDTGQVSQLYEIEEAGLSSELRIKNISWAPNELYIAGEVCEGFGPSGASECQIGVWTLDGAFFLSNTGYPENRNPVWFPIKP